MLLSETSLFIFNKMYAIIRTENINAYLPHKLSYKKNIKQENNPSLPYFHIQYNRKQRYYFGNIYVYAVIKCCTLYPLC